MQELMSDVGMYRLAVRGADDPTGRAKRRRHHMSAAGLHAAKQRLRELQHQRDRERGKKVRKTCTLCVCVYACLCVYVSQLCVLQSSLLACALFVYVKVCQNQVKLHLTLCVCMCVCVSIVRTAVKLAYQASFVCRGVLKPGQVFVHFVCMHMCMYVYMCVS